MSKEVHWVVNLAINEGKLDDFKAVMEDMIASAKREAGTMAYEWNFSADQTECYVYERYKDSASVVEHFGNFGPFADRFRAACVRGDAVVFGHPDAEAKTFLDNMEPVYAETLAGFTNFAAAD